MKLKILSAAFVIGLSVITYKSATYDPVPELVTKLQQGDSVTLDSGVVYDFTGYKDIRVRYLDLNGATIKATEMLQTTFNDNHFLFVMDSAGVIKNGTIIGANGRTESLVSGWFGAIKALNSGLIENMRFLDCDKFGIYGMGNRNHTNDSLTIKNCTFDNIVRSGGFYDTFEEGVKIKLRYYGTGISVSRPLVNQLDGYRCLMINVGSGYLEVGR